MNHYFRKCTMTRDDFFSDLYLFPEEEIFDEEDEELKKELEESERIYTRLK